MNSSIRRYFGTRATDSLREAMAAHQHERHLDAVRAVEYPKVCPDCGGIGGRRQGNDPQTDELCPRCDGEGTL